MGCSSVQSEEALSLMMGTASGSTETGTETTTHIAFEPVRLKVDTDANENKRYLLSFDGYTQTVVDLGNRLILVDNVLYLDTKLRSAMYDSRLQQAIDYIPGSIEVM